MSVSPVKRAVYIAKARRISIIGNLILMVLGCGLLALLALFLGKPYGICDAIFNKLKPYVHPALVGVVGMLPLLPVLVMPIVIPMALIVYIDRRIGVRCPHCGKSLTLRCRHKVVADTGKCELCHQPVFDEADCPGRAATQHSSP